MKKYTWIIITIIIIAAIGLGSWILFNSKGSGSFTSIKGDVVNVTNPHANQKITSPLVISGSVKGNWSFEANLPASLTDADGNIIVDGFATLQGNWMTSDYVPFEGTLTFAIPATAKKGFLVIKKDNPSGDPASDDSVKIPVKF